MSNFNYNMAKSKLNIKNYWAKFWFHFGDLLANYANYA